MNFIKRLWRKIFHKDYIVYNGTMRGVTITVDMNGDKIVLGEMKDFEVARPRIYLTHDIEFKEISIVDNPPDPNARIIGVESNLVHFDEALSSARQLLEIFGEVGITMEMGTQQLEALFDAMMRIKRASRIPIRQRRGWNDGIKGSTKFTTGGGSRWCTMRTGSSVMGLM